MNDSVATRQRYLLVLLLFLHTVNTYMDRVCISVAKGSMQEDISSLDDQMMGYVIVNARRGPARSLNQPAGI